MRGAKPPCAPLPLPLRTRWRRLLLGLRALAGQGGGYFIPARLVPPGRPRAEPPYRAAETMFATAWPGMAEILADLAAGAPSLLAIGDGKPPAPRWRQDWFPGLDAAVAYGLVRRREPARIIEIGSGHSTRFLARAIADGGLGTHLVAIDPDPRAKLEGLPVEWIGQPLQDLGEAPFAALRSGDMVFIDSSHVLMPGSDVDWLINRILPALPQGVLVHVHDIFLPDAYPADWAWRGYNEQQIVLALLSGGAFEILFASHYAITRHPDTARRGVLGALPRLPSGHESSLWLAKRTAAMALERPPRPTCMDRLRP